MPASTRCRASCATGPDPARSTVTPIAVTLTYDREGDEQLSLPERLELTVTPELAALFARAAEVNQRDATPLSFTSLLIGMLTERSLWRHAPHRDAS